MTTPLSNYTNQPLPFSALKGVVLDMDGVLWRGTETLPGTPEFFTYLQAQGIPFVLATNNSSKSVTDYVKRLSSLGVNVEPWQVITSGIVTADYLNKKYAAGTPAYVIGGDGLRTLLIERGFVIDPVAAQVVVVGLDIGLTYDKLRLGGRRILAGAEFLGTNADASIPVMDGFDPGCGTIIAALQMMTGVTARTFGKPQSAMFETALTRLGTSPSETLMIGDRLDTDILGAKRIGMIAAHVLTGVSTADDRSELPPDAVFDSLAGILSAWKSA